jgi:60 kDa SS-A/Ro ribonucleoprotein
MKQQGKFECLERFLTDGNEHDVESVRGLLATDGLNVVQQVAGFSTAGRPPKPNPALFVLALAASPCCAAAQTNSAALAALPQVVRSGDELLAFAAYVDQYRGWGRALRTAIANWYLSRPPRDLATDLLRATEFRGWSHSDLLRLSHPKPVSPEHRALFQWAVDGQLGHWSAGVDRNGPLRQVFAYEQLRTTRSEAEAVRLVEEYKLTHDMIPEPWRNSKAIWDALLFDMPYPDLVQNLVTLAKIGVLGPHSDTSPLIAARLSSRDRIVRSGLVPEQINEALSEYRAGAGWEPVRAVVEALEHATAVAAG